MSCTSVSCRYVPCDILGLGAEIFSDFGLRLKTQQKLQFQLKRDVYWADQPLKSVQILKANLQASASRGYRI